MINTWEELYKNFPSKWDDMTPEQAIEYVNHCFDLYEKEGFAKLYWTPYDDSHLTKHIGKPFKVIRRLGEPNYDLETLPAWMIQFDDGVEEEAYPEEIIPNEMIFNGCKLEGII